MAIQFVQADADDYSADYVLDANLTGCTVGNHIVVFSYCGTGVTTNSCADDNSNSYSQVLAGMTNRMKVYVAKITTGGDLVVSVTFNSNTDSYRRIIALEYSGMDPDDPYDTGAMPTGTWAGTTATDGAESYTISTAMDNALVLGVQKLNTSGTIAAGTGFTERVELTQYQAEDKILASAGSVKCTWTNSVANPFYPLITSWNPAAGLEYNYTGTIYETKTWGSEKSIEKLVAGELFSTAYWTATRVVEKVVPGGVYAVDYWASEKTFQRNIIGGLYAAATWISGRIISVTLTGSITSVRSFIASKMMEKYVEGAIISPRTWASVLTGISLDQEFFRFYNDDGDEDASTPLADLNTNVSGNRTGNVRLRFLIAQSGTAGAKPYQLEYKLNDGDWKRVAQ